MSYMKLNFYELISSYLICKASEDFLNNLGGSYDPSDLTLITSLVNGMNISYFWFCFVFIFC